MPSKQEKPAREKETTPTQGKGWEEVLNRVEENDEGMEKWWKDDIDTLLVFAGLFSAVVTAFTIESYQWLSEDPSDQSIAILAHISAQLDGRNITSFEPPSFTPSPSLVRINTFWFLSLILALVDALFGLMCKQWLREYRRATTTRTPEERLTLRWFRNEGFEHWHVPSFLVALPIILEIALFLFFAGLLELLWTKHSVPFAISAFVIGSAVVFYIATAILPGIDIIRLLFRIRPQSSGASYSDEQDRIPEMDFTCPYKSPQALAVFKLLGWLLSPASPFSRPIISYFLKKKFYNDKPHVENEHIESVTTRLKGLKDWLSVDLDIIKRFSEIRGCPDMYAMKAYRWVVHEFRDIPSMVPHLDAVLQGSPPHVVLPTVFGKEIVRRDREWDSKDVAPALEGRLVAPVFNQLFDHSREHLKLLYEHQVWINFINSPPHNPRHQPSRDVEHLSKFLSDSVKTCAPLTRILQSMPREVLNRDLALQCIEAFNDHFKQFNTRQHFIPYLWDPSNDRNSDGLDHDIRHFDFPVVAPFISSLVEIVSIYPYWNDKEPLLKLLEWLRKNMQFSVFNQLRDPYAYIDGLDKLRVKLGIASNEAFFRRYQGFFQVSMARVNELLSGSPTKLLIRDLEASYIAALQEDRRKEYVDGRACVQLVEHLVSYVFDNIPANHPNYTTELQEKLGRLGGPKPSNTSTNELPSLFTSTEGLGFLKVVNTHVRVRSGDEGMEDVCSRWKLGWECVQKINKPEY
ncbi:hypothetical protein PQX77_006515 [Marasmius sp. AFHP31]|nr:hypothetical protein PQX77_006515 [Marasmius sp. AFHP31]